MNSKIMATACHRPTRWIQPSLTVNASRVFSTMRATPSNKDAASSDQSRPNSSTLDLIMQLPTQFLRESDAARFDPVTRQRNDVLFDYDNGKPLLATREDTYRYRIQSCDLHNGMIHIEWEDGQTSIYTEAWFKEQLDLLKGTNNSSSLDRVLWTGWTEEMVRSSSTGALHFQDLLKPEGMSFALRALYTCGILLITNTPIDTSGSAAISAIASCLGGGRVKNCTTMRHSYLSGSDEIMLPRGTDGPLRTLYGTVWSTTSAGQEDGASVADSAYGNGSLPLHTDMTYMRDPPGLQIFTMVQPSLRGGASIFGDGFAVAERLRTAHPEAFLTLATTVRRYRSIDEATGWHLEASGPVITVDSHSQLVSIRHNDLDRLPDLPPVFTSLSNCDKFYEKLKAAHHLWDEVLSQDDVRLEMSLQKGDTVVVANQRCLHGRKSFESDQSHPRMVTGCYVSQDELNSRFRVEGFSAY